MCSAKVQCSSVLGNARIDIPAPVAVSRLDNLGSDSAVHMQDITGYTMCYWIYIVLLDMLRFTGYTMCYRIYNVLLDIQCITGYAVYY